VSEKEELVDTVWLACAIDGEGGIGIYLGSKLSLSPVIYVCNDNADFVGYAKAILESTSKILEPRGTYTVRLEQKLKIETVLKRVLPYLLVKRTQAQVVIKFIERRRQNSNAYTVDDWYDYLLLRLLNNRNRLSLSEIVSKVLDTIKSYESPQMIVKRYYIGERESMVKEVEVLLRKEGYV
jgi:hypothetical protein